MAGQEKEIGLVDLENFLSQQIPDGKKVNNIIEQLAISKQNLEKEMGEEMPSFYGEIFSYLNFGVNQDISKIFDKEGNLNNGYIQAVYKKVKEKYIAQKTVEENRKIEEKRQQNIDEVVERMTPEEIKIAIDKINFKNLTIEDLKFLEDYAEEFIENSTEEQYNQKVEALGKILGTSESLIEVQKLFKKMQNPNYKITEEDKSLAETISPELSDVIEFDRDKVTFSKNSQKIIVELEQKQASVAKKIKEFNELIQSGNVDVETAMLEIKSSIEAFGENGKLIFNEAVIENQFKMNQQDKQYSSIDNRADSTTNSNSTRLTQNQSVIAGMDELDFSAMAAEFSDGLAEFDALETQAVEAEGIEPTEQQTEDFGMDFTDEFADALADFDLEEQNALTVEEDMQQMQEVAELAMDDQMSKAVDYAEFSKEETIVEFEGDKGVFAQEEIPMQPEVTQDIAQEKVQAEQELKDYEMEIEEKTGLAGLFSKVKDFIQNIPAIQGLFAKTNKQERLGDGKPQVTREDGIKQTTYFGNGSLEPWTVRARNFAINLGSNVMEAIGKVAKSSNKEDKDVPINRPTIIKSQEKTNERTTEEQQIDNIELNPMQQQQMDSLKAVEQQGRKMDDNPWAINVDKNMEKEALARSANAGKSQNIDKSSSHDNPNHDDEDGTIGLG